MRRKLSDNQGKTKIMSIGKNQDENEIIMSLKNSKMEKVESYIFFSIGVSNNGTINEEVNSRIVEGRKSSGTLYNL